MSAPWLIQRGGETWFMEEPVAGSAFAIRVDRLIHDDTADGQHVLVFESERFGRVLVLDGYVQVTEADEHIYHEMMVHPALVAHDDPRRILIVGGGDGGILREVLKHTRVDRAVLVEIEPAVVDLSKTWMPHVSAGAFEDPRTDVVFADAAAWITETDETFDVIIVDSTDPTGPGAVLFTEAFYRDCRTRLDPSGALVTQHGVPFLQASEAAASIRRLQSVFKHVLPSRAAVPSYAGGDLLMALSAPTDAFGAPPTRQRLRDRFGDDGLKTTYYNWRVDGASRALPEDVKALLHTTSVE
ncbi:MAG: polyamine aminopropyltransferase [Pseudomonadota bacterium]